MVSKKQVDKALEFIEHLDKEKYPREYVRDEALFYTYYAISGASKYGIYYGDEFKSFDLKVVHRYSIGAMLETLQSINDKAKTRGVDICLFENPQYGEDDNPSFSFCAVRQETDVEYHKRVEALVKNEDDKKIHQLAEYKRLHAIFGKDKIG